jgi:small conductance mechanosensitive channel
MEHVADQIVSWIATSGLKVVGAILILLLGRILAGILRRFIKRMLTRRETDPGLTNFIAGLTYALVIIFALVHALAKFGIPTASFVAVLGAAGFAVGFALQGSLSNFASGVMLLVFKPFQVGDYIEAAGVSGSVHEIQLFDTILHTPDNVRIVIPNAKAYGDVIKNYSANDTRRVDLLIGIGYGSPIDKAIRVVEGLIASDSRILKEPESMIAVSELADSSVNLVIRSWVKKEDYWDVKFDLTRKIKESFDHNDIEIPFPQQVVHHANAPSQN